jgi:hypothetical protein
MGLEIEAIVKRMSEKARDDTRVAAVCGSSECVSVLHYGAENYLARILAKKQELGEVVIGLISFEPGKAHEPEVEFFPEYADDPTAVSWMKCCTETIRRNAGMW